LQYSFPHYIASGKEDMAMKEPIFNDKGMEFESPIRDTHEILKPPGQNPGKGIPEIRISAREKEVLRWVEQGKSSLEISLILGISQRTVNSYVYKIMGKFDAVNRTQMVAIALRKGFI
jgi:DNA-binding CsgD family transcriptional regulator